MLTNKYIIDRFEEMYHLYHDNDSEHMHSHPPPNYSDSAEAPSTIEHGAWQQAKHNKHISTPN